MRRKLINTVNYHLNRLLITQIEVIVCMIKEDKGKKKEQDKIKN
jgi:hypothetical protein